jgi:hypothetical protein
MEVPDELSHGCGPGRREGYKIVVIRKHRPGLQFPVVLFRQGQERVAKVLKGMAAAKDG